MDENRTKERPQVITSEMIHHSDRGVSMDENRTKERPQVITSEMIHHSDRGVSMDENRTKEQPQVIIKPLQRTSKPLQGNHVKCKATEPLVECLKRPARNLTRAEESGDDILFSLRTTVKLHKKRLPVLFKTWLSTVNLSNVFLVTDGKDANLEREIASTGS